jgi:GT2 family glycosyltransferase
MLLTFLIPAYCRKQGALHAALSVLEQCNSTTKGVVEVWVNDDCSPQFEMEQHKEQVAEYHQYCDIHISRNHQNLGMSRNIFKMVSSVKSGFWTVLTDDDFLLPGALLPLLDLLRASVHIDAFSVATLRYCFDASGHFLFKDAVHGTDYPSIIAPGPVNSMKHIQNAHVLTGLVIKSGLDLSSWKHHIDNAYFPMINFASALLSGCCVTINRPWFRHTVNNQTYWHQWGDSDLAISQRINTDYLAALSVSKNQAFGSSRSLHERFHVLRYYLWSSCSTLATFISQKGLFYVSLLVIHMPVISSLNKVLLFFCLGVATLNTASLFLKQAAKKLLLKPFRASSLHS